MFDLLMRDAAGAGVPVPLPGRGMVFLGLDGLLYTKRNDGEVMSFPLGPQGPQGVKGDTGAMGAQGPQGPQGPQGVAAQIGSALIARADSSIPEWTTEQRVVFAFQPPDMSISGGCISWEVMGGNDHVASAANIWLVMRIGGVVRAQKVFGMGTTLATARGWRARGRMMYDNGQFVASFWAEVDGLQTVPSGGIGEKLQVSNGDYLEVLAYQSVAQPGDAMRVLFGFAYREF